MATENETENTLESKGRKIHFTINLDDEQAAISAPEVKKQPLFPDETAILDKLNLVYKLAEYNTEHGMTSITVIDFQDDEQHQKALRLLTRNYSRIIWRMLPLLRKFGLHPRTDVRYRTAQAVGELMCEMDFIRIKDAIILPWAKYPLLEVNANIGRVFSVVTKHGKYTENVKKLLKHWSTVSDADLNRSALAGIIPLCATWPDETIEIVRTALGRDNALPWDYSMLVTLSAFALNELCKKENTEKVIENLKDWIADSDKSSEILRCGAALAFLAAIDLSHLLAYQAGRDKVISMYQVCLEERRLDNLGSIRTFALEKLREWAEESFGDEEKEEFVSTIFARLHRRSSTDRDKERIEFHVKRWQQQDKEKRFGFILDSLAY